MSQQILNVDELVELEQPIIKLGGVEHAMASMTVKDFVEAQSQAMKIDTSEDADPKGQMEHLTEFVMKSFPSITLEMIESLSLPQLTAVTDFIVGVSNKAAKTGGKKSNKANQ